MDKSQIQEIAKMVCENTIFWTKEVLTCDEAARYMGISKSYLYKLMMKHEISYSKPTGKMCYFKRTELEEWLLQNPCATQREMADRANSYTSNRRNNRCKPGA